VCGLWSEVCGLWGVWCVRCVECVGCVCEWCVGCMCVWCVMQVPMKTMSGPPGFQGGKCNFFGGEEGCVTDKMQYRQGNNLRNSAGTGLILSG